MYIPSMFFGQGVSCVTATSNGGISGSMTCGGVDWEYHLFTGSVFEDFTQYQFSILSGSTTQAKVFVLGGGGGGSIAANLVSGSGGGAGALQYVNNVFLRPTGLTDFTVNVGGGGRGRENIQAPFISSFNGGDGTRSEFIGFGYNIIANGGEGGEITTTYRGGASGTPLSGSTLGGGGGARVAATSGLGGIGFNILLSGSAANLFGNMIPYNWDEYNNQPFRVGGGGNNQNQSAGSGSYYGGGSGNLVDLMSNEVDGAINRGGGGRGIDILVSAGTYRQTRGGHGMVLVMYPKTACNRYLLPSVEQNNLIGWWDTKSTISFSDPLQSTLNDIKRAYNLNYTGSSDTLFNVYTSSLAQIVTNQDNTTGSLSTAIWSGGNSPGGIPPDDYRFEKRINEDFSTTGITMQGWFQYSGGSIENSQLMGISKNDGTTPILSVVNRPTQYAATTSATYLSGSAVNTATSSLDTTKWYQHTLTYSGTTLSYYVNSSLIGTANVSVPTDLLTNPVFQIGGRFIGGQFNQGVFNFGEVRVYNTALNSTQITSNYNANKARYGG